MKKTKFRRGLEKLLFTGLLVGALSNQLNAQPVIDEYGKNAAMNPYSQPNMHVLLGRNALDFYGSGDTNNDEVVSLEDSQAIRNGTESGNDRADVNGDGIVDNSDATMIENYLVGTITYLPGKDWNHLNRAERIDWFTKMLEIDKTDERTYISGVYVCTGFSTEHLINFFGVENLEDFGNYELYAEDGDDNARFNIPVYRVSTKVYSSGAPIGTEPYGHSIITVLVGPNSEERYSEDPQDFNHWYFVEPQLDLPVQPGDWSMNGDEDAQINWWGYFNFFRDFNSIGTISFNLENNIASEIYFQSPDLLTTNPNAPVPDTTPPTATFANDTTVSYPANLEAIIQASMPKNVSDNEDPNPVVSHTYETNQTSNGTCSDVSYDVQINWNIIDESGNDTTDIQNVYVRDTEAPSFTVPGDVYIKEHQSIEPDSTGVPNDLYDNSGLEIQTNYVDEIESESDLEKVLKRTWTATDVCGNDSSQVQYIYLEKPNGINDIESTNYGIEKIYPVPTDGNLNIEYNLMNTGKIHTEIYDTSGKLIDYMTEEGYAGENNLEMDVSKLKPGMYILNFTNDGKTSTKKFIKR